MTKVIEVRAVGKEYLRGVHHGHTRASEVLTHWAQSLVGRKRPANFVRRDEEPFWALKDVSFTVEQGQVVGIIGRNGSGKSTLLRIIAQITAPTSGEVHLRGRTGTLLEVGTGFHPELTGRENVFLNGAILGMSHTEIARKFDEIVDFSGVEEFIDTPVKRYSSGMQTRLAFSVAAHLDPEVLIIDEILAVGDAEFQKKCLAKMKAVTSDGRTVIFVSHSMATITSLCSQCVLLEHGKMQAQGPAHKIADLYFAEGTSSGASIAFGKDGGRPGDDTVRLCSARVVNHELKPVEVLSRDEAIGIEMTFEVLQGGHRLVPNFHLFTRGQYVLVSSAPSSDEVLAAGIYRSRMWIPRRFLNNGSFVVGVAVSTMLPVTIRFFEQDALRFHVVDDLFDPSRNNYTQEFPGAVRPDLQWDIAREQ